MDRLVTPEAVALDLPHATVATRAIGRVLDLSLQLLVLVLVLTGAGSVGADDVVTTVAALVSVFLVRIGYPVALETRFGATLGQRAMGLRIVSDDGGPIRLRQAVVRAAVGLFEIEMTGGLLAFAVAASRADGKRLGDVAAGTVAVSVRAGTRRAEVLAVECPPQLRGWAAMLDPTGLAPGHRVALRRFHERARDLPPDRRRTLAGPLADRMLAGLAAPPPAGAGPVEVLAAIQWAIGDGAAAARGPRGADGPGAGTPPPPPTPGAVGPPPPAPPGVSPSAPPVLDPGGDPGGDPGAMTDDAGFAPPS